MSDPRRLIVTEFAVIFDSTENQPPIVHHLDTEEGLNRLQEQVILLH